MWGDEGFPKHIVMKGKIAARCSGEECTYDCNCKSRYERMCVRKVLLIGQRLFRCYTSYCNTCEICDGWRRDYENFIAIYTVLKKEALISCIKLISENSFYFFTANQRALTFIAAISNLIASCEENQTSDNYNCLPISYSSLFTLRDFETERTS